MPKLLPEKNGHTDIYWYRVDSVVMLILENDKYLHSKRNSELVEIIMKKFSLEERMAIYYVAEAKKEVRRIGRADRQKAFVKAIRDREFLLLKAKGLKDKTGQYVEEPDYKLALEVLKDRDKLNGLYIEETKNESTVKNVDMNKFTEYGLERLKRGDKIEDILMDPKAVKSE